MYLSVLDTKLPCSFFMTCVILVSTLTNFSTLSPSPVSNVLIKNTSSSIGSKIPNAFAPCVDAISDGVNSLMLYFIFLIIDYKSY